jgi:hypothetical protein
MPDTTSTVPTLPRIVAKEITTTIISEITTTALTTTTTTGT